MTTRPRYQPAAPGARDAASVRPLAKCPTGIAGLDEVMDGGLPAGRPTLVCGAAGCGKTLLAMEFLIRGATQFQDPGVFVSFEESADDLATNVANDVRVFHLTDRGIVLGEPPRGAVEHHAAGSAVTAS
jgi:circadian clock protein KaiC